MKECNEYELGIMNSNHVAFAADLNGCVINQHKGKRRPPRQTNWAIKTPANTRLQSSQKKNIELITYDCLLLPLIVVFCLKI